MADRAVFTIPADLGRLADVRSFVRESLSGLAVGVGVGVGADALADLVQAVDECVTNVIVHGYTGRAGEVEIEAGLIDGAVVVRVRDSAGPFDPAAVPPPDPNRSLEERVHGGMGVPLMRASVDELHHRLLPDGRNELTMIKRIGPAE